MMKLWSLLLIFTSLEVLGQETKPIEEVTAEYFNKYLDEPRLSKKYIRGNFLVYDCEFMHYACINKDSNLNCTKENKCMKIKEFPNQKECFEVHTKFQEKTKISAYCKSIL